MIQLAAVVHSRIWQVYLLWASRQSHVLHTVLLHRAIRGGPGGSEGAVGHLWCYQVSGSIGCTSCSGVDIKSQELQIRAVTENAIHYHEKVMWFHGYLLFTELYTQGKTDMAKSLQLFSNKRAQNLIHIPVHNEPYPLQRVPLLYPKASF